jgi:Glycosyl transferase 4-like domain
MKRVLIISPHFPPINAPDMQRVRMSLPFYRENGWDPVVLAVGEPWQDGVREPELLATLPADIRVIYVRALPPRWSRFLGVGNVGLRSWPFLLWHGTQLLRREKFDLIFFSTTQFVTLSLGLLWRRWFKVPYVIDVQDPWRTDYYERPGSRRPPGGWKYQFARLQARLLEGRTFRRASAVMSVSPSYVSDLRERYQELEDTPTAVIRFGASRGDIPHALAIVQAPFVYPRGDGQVHFLYTGASGPVMPHALTVLFTALRLYQERKPDAARRLRFHFIGTSYVAPGRGKPSVLPVAALCDVAANVDEIPHRIGHLESLRLQLDADVLLLPGSSDLAYSPSKIYPYYLTGRPMLGLVFRDSVMEHLLDELACAYMVRFRQAEAKDDAYASLHRFFDLALEGFPPGSLPVRRDSYFRENYLADELTRQQCLLFEQAVAHAAVAR